MEMLSLLRTMGALGIVLGLLVGALWLVRRFDLTLPQKWLGGMSKQGAERRLEVIERLTLDPRRSIVLIRRDDQEYSVLIAPEGIVHLDPQPAQRTALYYPRLKPQDHDQDA